MKTRLFPHLVSRYAGGLLLLAATMPAIHAADFLGASAVIKDIQNQLAAASGQKIETNDISTLRADLKAFANTATNLPPADAARRWLELVDRAAKIPPASSANFQSFELLNALPPPSAWNALAQAVTSRSDTNSPASIHAFGLQLLASTLTGDEAARTRVIAAFQARAGSADMTTAYMFRSMLQQIQQVTLARTTDPQAILQSLNSQVDSAGASQAQDINVPDIVSQLGADKAEAFLRRALVQPGVTLRCDGSGQTGRLAQKLALELMDQLKQPQWNLVNSLDAVDLYEAMLKKFPAPKISVPGLSGGIDMGNGMDFSKITADTYYLLGLISHDRAKDAVVVAKKLGTVQNQSLPSEAFAQMEQAGYAAALDSFFYELLTEDPTLPFWTQYMDIAAQAGQTSRMVALARAAAARQDLPEKKKSAVRRILFRALLADDEVDEGVQQMRSLIAQDTPVENETETPGQLGVMIAQLGVLLHRPEWISEGIDDARKSLAKPAAKVGSYGGDSVTVCSLAKILEDQQRGPEAETVLKDALARARMERNVNGQEWSDSIPTQYLTDLAALYLQFGRPADVITLLQESPYWNAKDLSDLFQAKAGDEFVSLMDLHTGSSALPLPYLVADAFFKTGHREEAAKITQAVLQQYPGSDRGYELLIALDPTNALAQMDGLFARDQFEERPLIWKAYLLEKQGDLETAEKIVRQAIAIDPSDGEEGRGDRMRAYAVLADIRAARGSQKDADFYRQVVQAIRLSENADQFYLAGLLKHAVSMYQEALGHFSDAYCIQSRLARQLSALGMNAAAEEHYRRAFELMPDSFGRVESHCFGCEKAFAGERAQGIAEQVFDKIAAERPDKPQVHYLLGYLRVEEERYTEASTNFLTAVRLDPEYLNAWVKLQEVAPHVLLPANVRRDIPLNILRLDPLQNHASPELDQVDDLTALWNAVAAAAQHRPAPVSDLLPLPASESEMKKAAPDNFRSEAMQYFGYDPETGAMDKLLPASAVAQTPFVRLAGQMMDQKMDADN